MTLSNLLNLVMFIKEFFNKKLLTNNLHASLQKLKQRTCFLYIKSIHKNLILYLSKLTIFTVLNHQLTDTDYLTEKLSGVVRGRIGRANDFLDSFIWAHTT